MRLTSRGSHNSSQVVYLLDTREFITDCSTVRQVTHFAHVHRLGSPLWLSCELASALGLTLRYMCSPLNIWSPLTGESFVQLASSPALARDTLYKFPINKEFLAPGGVLPHNSGEGSLMALSAAASSDGKPRWYNIPKDVSHLFVLPKNLCQLSVPVHRGGFRPRPFNLWVSTVIAVRMGGLAEAVKTVRTPSSFMTLVNADQMYPSALLAEKELECVLLMRKEGRLGEM
ncbi:uncharacterized protein TEOVI_000883200 [Trypanosoma equiperdum]|uniref:Uncharacterized protein n=4 Tax=Trypanozoon TaxID=39700 RepID=Q57UU1_TRYB2|nr:hypothetical protein, conserved [Trypanosoma brucei gambiense DAL972]XP_844184.1 hypothetical protein, conserved [Trypanosoma brucei brucei TREU927]AAX70636.1 hypothetical protein, conserved [Trypanosoma brucei]RHW73041.1 hypothetical protein DPX39_040005800 [Trypanosoma brucei equiperdum]SCU66014.1 hypothetical protein, conserved [Trypanosoma equiperdum]AAZ10625.1 hypothetical protein, conserved [Trypanosoma brucei brucei TREU927]CBH10299.1 hypothetical protein, conserved [Trypanosoma bru|eukprot:XP_011772589.1 hypothetical protein, conserved [Trypanosoma brucei gambiense DAL972]